MKIAVLSDIHGNYVALEECIRYALSRKVSLFIFLGDYVGELAYPEKTMEIIVNIINEYPCHFIRGNKEDYWLNYQIQGEKGWKDQDSTTGSLLYTYNHLAETDMSFFRGMPISGEIRVKDMPYITICHGSPARNNEKMLPENEKTFEIVKKDKNSIILCGHTHIQEKMEHNGKVVLNPGAAGVSLRSAGKAQLMILHAQNNQWKEEFISLDYDVEKVVSDLYESGLAAAAPQWCKVSENLLRTGEISHSSVLARAMILCEEEKGFCTWPDIPEKYWEQAVREMIID